MANGRHLEHRKKAICPKRLADLDLDVFIAFASFVYHESL